MNLSKNELAELNQLLAKTKLGLPDFRREIGPSGNNYQWVRKALKNKAGVPDRLRELLNIGVVKAL